MEIEFSKYGEVRKREGTKFIKECSGDATQLVQVDGKVYGVDLIKGVPQSVADLTDMIKGKDNGHKPI